jgi:hypothetical protein
MRARQADTYASENPREVELGYIASHRSSNCPDCKQQRSEKQCGLPAKTIANPDSQEWTGDATQQSTAGSKTELLRRQSELITNKDLSAGK